MLQKKLHSSFGKFLLFSTILIVLFNIGINAIDANNSFKKITDTTNKENFKKVETSDIAKSSIAIVLNLGLRYGDKENISNTIFKEIYSVEEFFKSIKKAEKDIILDNMVASKEYYSILKTDFRYILQKSNNRGTTLTNILKQLKFRLKIGLKSVDNIKRQQKIFVDGLEKIDAELDKVRSEISIAFRKTDTEVMTELIDRYNKLKYQHSYIKTQVVFENRFLLYFGALNNYNSELINALEINRNIIVSGSYLVIPNRGKNLLKDYGLIYSEEEYENKIKKERVVEEKEIVK